jgi:hypothetical protein
MSRFVFFATLIFLVFNTSASSQEQNRKASQKVKMAYLADQLIELGIHKDEPLYILAAASLYRDSVISDQTPEGKQTLQSLVERAQELSPGDVNIQKLGEKITTPTKPFKVRGPTSSVKEKHGVLAAGEKIVYLAEFEGGVDASVALVLDPKVVAKLNSRSDFGVDFFVRDAQSRDICSVQSTTIPYTCSWTPSEQSKFRIELRNSGGSNAPFALYFE